MAISEAGQRVYVSSAATPADLQHLYKIRRKCFRKRQFLTGKSVLHDSDGSERTLNAGDNFIIPADFKGEWEPLQMTMKICVIY